MIGKKFLFSSFSSSCWICAKDCRPHPQKNKGHNTTHEQLDTVPCFFDCVGCRRGNKDHNGRRNHDLISRGWKVDFGPYSYDDDYYS